jgi:hypothetical protein
VLGAAARHASVCVSIALRGLEQPAAGVDGRPIGLHSESDGVSIARTKRAASLARGQRALAAARELRYTSIYVFPTRGCSDIEGYFDFGRKGSFPVWLVAGGAVNRWAISYWEEGEPIAPHVGLGNAILIPGDEVTPELAAEALQRWYRSRFEFKRHHWTHLTGKEPTIVLDLNWVGHDQGRGALS